VTAGGDALAAAGVLAVVAVAGVAVDVALAPLAVLAGAAGAVALELLASARAAPVRTLWGRPGVRVLAVAVAVALVAVAAVAVPDWGLNALAGGLLAYLALLALVAAGVLPASTDWFDRPET